jgi:hypothetical protein
MSSLRGRAPKFHLFVKTQSGETLDLRLLNDFQSIYTLKILIKNITGTPIDEQQLEFNGEVLENCTRLAEGISNLNPPTNFIREIFFILWYF